MPAASSLPLGLDAILHQLPGNYILMAPGNTVLDASDSYLAAALKRRENIVGTNILDAYTAAEQNEWQVLADSSEQVRRHRKPYAMPRIRYDLKRSTEDGSRYEERYWQATNHPILGQDGELLYILRRTSNVTAENVAELERKAMKRDLAERQERAQFILQPLPAVLWASPSP